MRVCMRVSMRVCMRQKGGCPLDAHTNLGMVQTWVTTGVPLLGRPARLPLTWKDSEGGQAVAHSVTRNPAVLNHAKFRSCIMSIILGRHGLTHVLGMHTQNHRLPNPYAIFLATCGNAIPMGNELLISSSP